jgi:hypothetical protein
MEVIMARHPTPMSQGTALIGAAIIGGSILASGALVNTSIRGTSDKLDAIQVSLTETRDQLKTLASARPAPAAKPKQRGPDPDKRYTIKTQARPAKGPATAKVEVVEFSDFQ